MKRSNMAIQSLQGHRTMLFYIILFFLSHIYIVKRFRSYVVGGVIKTHVRSLINWSCDALYNAWTFFLPAEYSFSV